MKSYIYFVQDADYLIQDKEFENFADAYDYAQDGLTTSIIRIPVVDGVEYSDEAESVWAWDSTLSRDEAIKRNLYEIAYLKEDYEEDEIEDDELSDEEFLEAFGKALINRRNKKVYEDIDSDEILDLDLDEAVEYLDPSENSDYYGLADYTIEDPESMEARTKFDIKTSGGGHKSHKVEGHEIRLDKNKFNRYNYPNLISVLINAGLNQMYSIFKNSKVPFEHLLDLLAIRDYFDKGNRSLLVELIENERVIGSYQIESLMKAVLAFTNELGRPMNVEGAKEYSYFVSRLYDPWEEREAIRAGKTNLRKIANEKLSDAEAAQVVKDFCDYAGRELPVLK